MAKGMQSSLSVKATMVANEFIDRYMVSANGEYVKVYLYLLRHEAAEVQVPVIADALSSTEADVRRALAYWKKLGILDQTEEEDSLPEVPKKKERSTFQLEELSQDKDFSQFLYVTQQYLGKPLTPADSDRLAYLYEDLKMSTDLLEYLIETCAEAGHREIRYIEAVGVNWHKEGIVTVEQAKEKRTLFSKDMFAVMRAFGISERNPGEAERKIMDVWFRTYGFSKEIVLEACSRTIETIHKPSFRYADKILSEWKKAGVKRLSDIAQLDGRKKQNGEGDRAQTSRTVKETRGNNRFHNFEQSSYDYDAMVWDMIKEQQ
ncbi:MAG: DnaD domain protein [Lachnospiraceae bacterium]